ncbi:MAG TPA: hypothetical protein DEH02_06310 [Bacteroidales bacterium]|nr:hypothetical protein [Bacteroidales bacterium]
MIDIAEDYNYTVVSYPNHQYLWILSRTTSLPENLYSGILQSLLKNGFDTARLVQTIHASK